MANRISISILTAVLLTASSAAAWAITADGGASFTVANRGGGERNGERGGFLGEKMVQELNLSTDQQARIKSIKEKYRQNHERGEESFDSKFKAALQAPTVDERQLRGLLNEQQERSAQYVDHFVPMLAEIREVLTPEQRDKLAASGTGKGFMMMGHRGGKGGMGHLFSDLKLTPSQQQAVKDLQAEMKRERDASKGQHEQMKNAFGNFMRNGDRGALRSALLAGRPHMPIDSYVRILASLDQSQRSQIAQRLGERGEHAFRHNRNERHGSDT